MGTPQRLLQEVRRALLATFALGAFAAVTLLALPFYALHVVDGVVAGGTPETLLLLTLLAAGALAAQTCLEAARHRILLRAGLWLDHTLGQRMLENGLRLGLPAAEMNQNARALAVLRGALAGGALVAVLDAPWVPIFLLAMLLLQPALAGLAAIFALLLVLAGLAQGSRLAALEQERTRAAARARSWWDGLAGVSPMTGALGLAESASMQWERLNRAHVAGAYGLGQRSGFLAVLAGSIRAVSTIVLLAAGAWLAWRNQLTPGALVACLLLNASLLAPLTQLVSALPALQGVRLAYRRLALLPGDASAPAAGEARTATGIALANVTCRREARAAPALTSVSLTLPGGRTLGIKGPRGSGKSTLAAVLAGAMPPTEGTATLDGVPIGDWLRGDAVRVGYLPDTPALLEGTVHQNIARFRDTSLLAVSLAAMRAGVHDALAELPQGYQTQVGPGGSALSLRERRAVALARALFGAPALVVLDEPELGLDSAGLRRLVRVLEDLKQDGASLVIATENERLLELADAIATLEGGALQSLASSGERPVLSELGQYADPSMHGA